jgi:SMC interacting uncharacterized protein involved in chromosome segregation
MTDLKQETRKTLEALEQQRDELRVQVHLAKAEAKTEWEKMEKKLSELRAQSDKVAKATGESAKDIGAAIRLLGEEIKRGYERIRNQI